jgi:hypothetical protein
MDGVKVVVKGTGIQYDLKAVVPESFDFERDVLRGGVWDPQAARLLLDLSFRDMFPINEGRNLFLWDSLRPHVAFSIARAALQINRVLNKDAISNGQYRPVTDEMVLEKIRKTGVMSPKEVAADYAPVSLRLTR